MKVPLFLLAAASLLASAKTSANKAPPPKPPLYFSKNAAGGVPTKKFSCKEDTVYAFIRLPKKIYGKHDFWFYWRRPDGTLQDSTQLYVPSQAPGQRTFPAYLQFHIPDADVVDIFFASGEEAGDEFSGLWHARAVLDGKVALRGSFKVVCP